jgi:methionyl-tRNA formyltransferase
MNRVPYVLLGNGAVARRFLEASERAGSPAAVVLNAAARQREGDAIRSWCQARGIRCSDWSDDTKASLLSLLSADPSLWLLSVYFGYVLDADILAAASGRAVNLHASLLPWNRGVHTNVWPILDGSPAGVSLHAMQPRVDAGPVLAQAEVRVDPWDTGASLYRKLEEGGLALLLESWPHLVLARWPGAPQPEGGSSHRLRDFARLDSVDVDVHPEVRRFFDLLRARSFPPHRGLRVKVGGADVEAKVTLEPWHD